MYHLAELSYRGGRIAHLQNDSPLILNEKVEMYFHYLNISNLSSVLKTPKLISIVS